MKFKFRLRGGQHIQDDLTKPPKKIKLTDPDTGEVTLVDKYPPRTYNAGDVVESDVDLAEKFGGEKFGRIHADDQHTSEGTAAEIEAKVAALNAKLAELKLAESARTPKPEGEKAEAAPEVGLKLILPANLDRMTIAELRKFAEEEEVELHGRERREDIIRILRDSAK